MGVFGYFEVTTFRFSGVFWQRFIATEGERKATVASPMYLVREG